MRFRTVASTIALALAIPALSMAQSFSVSGTGSDGKAQQATAVFTFGAGTLDITITNDYMGDDWGINSGITGLGFGLSSGTVALSTVTAPGAVQTADNSHGSAIVPADLNPPTQGWTYNSSRDSALAAGDGSWKPYSIVNGTLTSTDGIPNAPHNPYLLGPVTFSFTGDVTADTTANSVRFYFGTGGEYQVVPIPGTALLLGSGLAGLGLFRRKK